MYIKVGKLSVCTENIRLKNRQIIFNLLNLFIDRSLQPG